MEKERRSGVDLKGGCVQGCVCDGANEYIGFGRLESIGVG